RRDRWHAGLHGWQAARRGRHDAGPEAGRAVPGLIDPVPENRSQAPVFLCPANTVPDNPARWLAASGPCSRLTGKPDSRSEEHTSELQSRENLVCRLLLEKKKEHDQDIRPM